MAEPGRTDSRAQALPFSVCSDTKQAVETSVKPGIQSIISTNHFKKFLNLFNVYLFLRERESERVSGGGAEREREKDRQTDRQNLKQAPGSELSAQSPTQGSNPQMVRS